MTDDLFWPGDHRAGELFTAASFAAALVAVEAAWLDTPLAEPADLLERVAVGAEAGGNPVIPLVTALREANPDLADRIHAGLTSQDVLDTALVLLVRDAVSAVLDDVRRQLVGLDALLVEFGEVAMLGRTLTQPALPITFGHKLGSWTTGVLESQADLATLIYPVQCGGPVGVGVTGPDGDGATALARRLGLADEPAWHTRRRTLTRIGDALVAATDAWGRIARDVLELSRPEIGELGEGTPGGSSSMPHKQNPVLSVLIRRAALTTPMLAATLHLAAAEQVDERADGGWHAEWDTLRIVARRAAVAASQTADLLEGLTVHADRMADNLERWGPSVPSG